MKRFHGRIARVCSLAYSPDGASIVSAGAGGLIRRWDAFEGREVLRFRSGYQRISSVAYSPDGSTVATVEVFGTVHLWVPLNGKPVATIRERTHGPLFLDFRPDGRAIVTAGWTRMVRGPRGSAVLWDLETRRSVAQFTLPADVHCARFSPDGSRVAVGSAMEMVCFWDPVKFPQGTMIDPPESLAAGALRNPWTIPHKPSSRCLAYSPDGRFLAASAGWSIAVYEVSTGRLAAKLRGHRQLVRSVAIAPDGRTLASAGFDGMLRFWDLPGGEERACLDWGSGNLECVAFSPDGSTVAAGGDGGIVVWDVE